MGGHNDFEGDGGHVNHERWLISYADFITLLFAVFVVLFSSASMDKSKAKTVSASVELALKSGLLNFSSKSEKPGPTSGSRPNEGTPGKQSLPTAEILPTIQNLSLAFREEIKAGKMEVHLEARGLVISLKQAAFFGSGHASLNQSADPILEKIATLIKSVPNHIRLEGHTDNVPIHTSAFSSNWELSAARSINMLNRLSDTHGVDRHQLSIAAFADNAPLSSNDDNEGRARNRRVDLVVVNDAALKSELTEEVAAKEKATAKAKGGGHSPKAHH